MGKAGLTNIDQDEKEENGKVETDPGKERRLLVGFHRKVRSLNI